MHPCKSPKACGLWPLHFLDAQTAKCLCRLSAPPPPPPPENLSSVQTILVNMVAADGILMNEIRIVY